MGMYIVHAANDCHECQSTPDAYVLVKMDNSPYNPTLHACPYIPLGTVAINFMLSIPLHVQWSPGLVVHEWYVYVQCKLQFTMVM